ncbi:MAG: lamin tail domain-containing protein [Verrucomicrobia bacterium]|nr:lamin tail domain-containing protein [Verrucomicrobiota bacterium]
MSRRFFAGAAGAGLLAILWSGAAATLIEKDAEWRYFKGVEEASSPDTTAWRKPGFDDSSWPAGRAPFFYDRGVGYEGNTELADMYGGYTCIYLRREFEVDDPSRYGALTISGESDDGCVIWINGKEAVRVNMGDGEPLHDWTSQPASGEPNLFHQELGQASDWLVPGKNVVAIQAFNASLNRSSDFLIDAELECELDVEPPQLVGLAPAAGLRVRELTAITVVFDDNVSGVDAADLLINGIPAASVVEHTPREYEFRFPEPPEGEVQVEWAADSGIRDAAGNPFGGGSWTYILDKSAPVAQVIISEFLAVNDHGIRDDDGNRSDWIELCNLGPEPANLQGWFLTDDASDLTKWRLPAVQLGVGQYLLVWASGKDRRDPNRPLHANFKLSAGGEYLALTEPRTNVVSAFAPAYPPQRPDISYGRDPVDPSVEGFFPTPTPGKPNAVGGEGFAPDPVFSLPGGVYTNQTLIVQISAPSGEIHYTLDGTVPTQDSPRYTDALRLAGSRIVMARVFQEGLLPSRVVENGYVLLDESAVGFSSNLPLLVIQPSSRNIPQDRRIPAHVVELRTRRGRASLLEQPGHMGLAQIEVRGQTSAGFPKKPYNLELDDPYGNDMEVPLLGLPAESDWVLYNPYSDKSFLNNFLAFELHEKMGHYAVRRRFCEVFVDDSSGRLQYPQDYKGIYVLLEKIKVDNNRVNIARLTPEMNQEPEISGGYIVKKDKNSPGDLSFSTSGGGGFSGQSLKCHEPKPREITDPQKRWIRDYLNNFEKSLYAVNWLQRTGTNHYSHYIDVASFVDNHWIVEFSKQIDGYRLSNYMSKDRGGKLKMEPIWDWNLSFGNADYLEGWRTQGWYYPLINENQHIWLRRLICGSTSGYAKNGDPDFLQAIADRWAVLRTNIFNPTNVCQRVDEIAAYLDEAKDRDFARWPRLNTRVWPNPSFYIAPTYRDIIEAKKRWIRGRFAWIDSQFLRSPELLHAGGPVPSGFLLRLFPHGGTIYYTTDGSDPRLPGGAINPAARVYSGSIVIDRNMKVVARAYSQGKWSGPAAGSFMVRRLPLRIVEIMYHPPASLAPAGTDPDELEYLELVNIGQAELDLKGFRLTKGVLFDFSTGAVSRLGPGERVAVVANEALFRQVYGDGAKVAGEYAKRLSNQGEELVLTGPADEEAQRLRYKDGWQPATDGVGFALVAAAPDLRSDLWRDRRAWRTGSVFGGTPGAEEPPPPDIPKVVINEALAHTDPPDEDAIELFNPGAAEADVSGWYLSDDFRTPKYRLPPGSVLPPGGFLAVGESQFNAPEQGTNRFQLRSAGDELYLFSADAEGRLTGYVHGFSFGGSLNGVSFGRYVNSAGEELFVPQIAPTLGTTNAGPRVGPVIISEVMYHPPDVFTNQAYWDNEEEEYIELWNLADAPTPLFDPNAPTNVWRLRGGVRFMFPTNTWLEPGERVLVTSFSPTNTALLTRFRTRYGVSGETRLFGPYAGKLSNGGETLELARPDQVRFYTNNPITIRIAVDRVSYEDGELWPAGADGTGLALQRAPETAFGDDPASWIAAPPSPGEPPPAGALPRILSQPDDVMTESGHDVRLAFAAESTAGALSCQWFVDGSLIRGATEPVLILTNAQPEQSGVYQAAAFNAAGAVQTRPILVRIFPRGGDSDSDGISDLYETLYGLDTMDPADANEDADGDGQSNGAEAIAGTDPFDPESRFRIQRLEAGAAPTLHFLGARNRTYSVLYTDDPVKGPWLLLTDVPPLPEAGNDLVEIKVTDASNPLPPRRFYRLQAR